MRLTVFWIGKKDAGVGVDGKIGSSSCSARTGTLSSTSSGTVAVVTGGYGSIFITARGRKDIYGRIPRRNEQKTPRPL